MSLPLRPLAAGSFVPLAVRRALVPLFWPLALTAGDRTAPGFETLAAKCFLKARFAFALAVCAAQRRSFAALAALCEAVLARLLLGYEFDLRSLAPVHRQDAPALERALVMVSPLRPHLDGLPA